MTAPEARERTGRVFYDWADQVFRTSVVTVFLSLYLPVPRIRRSAVRNPG
jgi:MFS-type transporter involved in bile tolerance (Atg22 family)